MRASVVVAFLALLALLGVAAACRQDTPLQPRTTVISSDCSGSGCCGSLRTIQAAPRTGAKGHIIICDNGGADGGLSSLLTLTCGPSPVVRGQNVSCSLLVDSNYAFTVVERAATGRGFSALDDSTRINVAAGQAYIWAGTAVANTSIRIAVQLTGTNPIRQESESSTFVVQARTWPDLGLQRPPVQFRSLSGPMTAYPGGHSPVPSGTLITWGRFYQDYPHFVSDTVNGSALVTSGGPNSGLAFMSSAVQQPDSSWVYTHPALYPSATGASLSWYQDQNAIPSGTCGAAGIAFFAGLVEAHEGITRATNSHFGVSGQQYAALHPQAALESLYIDAGDKVRLRIQADSIYYLQFYLPLQAAQVNFDSLDYPVVKAKIDSLCRRDYNLSDP